MVASGLAGTGIGRVYSIKPKAKKKLLKFDPISGYLRNKTQLLLESLSIISNIHYLKLSCQYKHLKNIPSIIISNNKIHKKTSPKYQ